MMTMMDTVLAAHHHEASSAVQQQQQQLLPEQQQPAAAAAAVATAVFEMNPMVGGGDPVVGRGIQHSIDPHQQHQQETTVDVEVANEKLHHSTVTS